PSQNTRRFRRMTTDSANPRYRWHQSGLVGGDDNLCTGLPAPPPATAMGLLASDEQAILASVSRELLRVRGKIAQDSACDRRGRLHRLAHLQGARASRVFACRL